MKFFFGEERSLEEWVKVWTCLLRYLLETEEYLLEALLVDLEKGFIKTKEDWFLLRRF